MECQLIPITQFSLAEDHQVEKLLELSQNAQLLGLVQTQLDHPESLQHFVVL